MIYVSWMARRALVLIISTAKMIATKTIRIVNTVWYLYPIGIPSLSSRYVESKSIYLWIFSGSLSGMAPKTKVSTSCGAASVVQAASSSVMSTVKIDCFFINFSPWKLVVIMSFDLINTYSYRWNSVNNSYLLGENPDQSILLFYNENVFIQIDLILPE